MSETKNYMQLDVLIFFYACNKIRLVDFLFYEIHVESLVFKKHNFQLSTLAYFVKLSIKTENKK